MKHALVITGGEGPSLAPPLAYDRIIAADSGYDTALRLSLKVDEVVGDLDSTAWRKQLVDSGFIPCNHDKDETDTELALMRLSGEWTYDLLGGGGGRIDHLMALYATFRSFGQPRLWLTGCNALISVEGSMSLSLPPGSGISFFSLAPAVVNCRALVWPLEDYRLCADRVSLSNRTVEEEITVTADAPVFIRVDSALSAYLFAKFS